MQPFADLVEVHRRRCHLTQAGLAQRVGVTQPTLAEWLSGRRPVPAKRLQRLIEALGLRGAARDNMQVAAWLAAVPPPVAHLLQGLMRHAGPRRVATIVRQAVIIAEAPPRPPQSSDGAPG